MFRGEAPNPLVPFFSRAAIPRTRPFPGGFATAPPSATDMQPLTRLPHRPSSSLIVSSSHRLIVSSSHRLIVSSSHRFIALLRGRLMMRRVLLLFFQLVTGGRAPGIAAEMAGDVSV